MVELSNALGSALGGQEINTGEAGLTEWFDALQKRFGHWDVYYSDRIGHRDYNWGHIPQDNPNLASAEGNLLEWGSGTVPRRQLGSLQPV